MVKMKAMLKASTSISGAGKAAVRAPHQLGRFSSAQIDRGSWDRWEVDIWGKVPTGGILRMCSCESLSRSRPREQKEPGREGKAQLTLLEGSWTAEKRQRKERVGRAGDINATATRIS
jgi:hypothetical protein